MARRKKNQENVNETEDFKPTPLNDNDPELETAYLNSYPMRRKTPCFSYGDIRRVHRIYASN